MLGKGVAPIEIPRICSSKEKWVVGVSIIAKRNA
jgi:hypothetical protein